MTDGIEELRRRMEAAAEALDFEEAKRLRDMLDLVRGGRQSRGGVTRWRLVPMPIWPGCCRARPRV